MNYVYYHENRTEIVGILESISDCDWKRKDSYIEALFKCQTFQTCRFVQKCFLLKTRNCLDFTNFLCLQMWRAAYLLQQSLNGGNNCWNSKVSAHLNIFPSNRGVIKPYQASNPALSQKISTINLKNNGWKKTLAQFEGEKNDLSLSPQQFFFRFFSSQSFYTRFSHVTVNSQFDWLSFCMNFLTPQRSVDKVTRTLNKHQGIFGFFRNNFVKYCSKKWINMMMCFMSLNVFSQKND